MNTQLGIALALIAVALEILWWLCGDLWLRARFKEQGRQAVITGSTPPSAHKHREHRVVFGALMVVLIIATAVAMAGIYLLAPLVA